MRSLILLSCSILLWACSAETEKSRTNASSLVVSDAWIRQAPPSARVLAAYFTLRNNSAQDWELRHLDSPSFERVELHGVSFQDGMMRMKALLPLRLAADSELRLAPGGTHLMLTAPSQALAAGDTITLNLRFASASGQENNLSLEATVQDAPHGAMHEQ